MRATLDCPLSKTFVFIPRPPVRLLSTPPCQKVERSLFCRSPSPAAKAEHLPCASKLEAELQEADQEGQHAAEGSFDGIVQVRLLPQLRLCLTHANSNLVSEQFAQNTTARPLRFALTVKRNRHLTRNCGTTSRCFPWPSIAVRLAWRRASSR